MPGQGIQIEEYKNEITRYEERLNSIRHEVDGILKRKHESELAVAEAMKNGIFLEGENTKKEAELARKQEIVASLDSQITAKQSQFDTLQGEVSAANAALATALAEKEDAEARTLEHGRIWRDEHQKLDDKRKVTEENHRISQEKLQKIQDLIKSLN